MEDDRTRFEKAENGEADVVTDTNDNNLDALDVVFEIEKTEPAWVEENPEFKDRVVQVITMHKLSTAIIGLIAAVLLIVLIASAGLNNRKLEQTTPNSNIRDNSSSSEYYDNPDGMSLEEREQIVNVALSESKQTYYSNGSTEANKIIKKALKKVPDDAELLRYKGLYDSCRSVALSDLTVLEKSNDEHVYTENTISDTFDNDYSNGLCMYLFWMWGVENITYATNSEYNLLTGTLFVNGEDNEDCKFEVYGDGKKIYSSETINRRTRPIPVSIDISGYDDVKFVGRHSQKSNSYIYLAEPTVSKSLTEEDFE